MFDRAAIDPTATASGAAGLMPAAPCIPRSANAPAFPFPTTQRRHGACACRPCAARFSHALCRSGPRAYSASASDSASMIVIRHSSDIHRIFIRCNGSCFVAHFPRSQADRPTFWALPQIRLFCLVGSVRVKRLACTFWFSGTGRDSSIRAVSLTSVTSTGREGGYATRCSTSFTMRLTDIRHIDLA